MISTYLVPKIETAVIATAFMFTVLSCSTLNKKEQITQEISIIKDFEIIGNLGPTITETSGLAISENLLITHNDSDSSPTIYFMNLQGEIVDQVDYINMKNIDWEDITIGNSNLYIADSGNNYGTRDDLKIYKFPVSQIKNAAVTPDEISFTYKDQLSFKTDNQNHSFDGEAITYIDNKLLLFSKDWVNFNTEIYQIKETNNANVLKSLQTLSVNGLITGSTYNGSNRVVLCGYNSGLQPFIVVLKLMGNGSFIMEDRIDLPLNDGAQIEAITFYSHDLKGEIYYLTSEAVNIKLGEDEAQTNGQLYKLTLKRE